METLFQQILNLLIEPPGNVIYHLVLSFAIIAGLQAVIIARGVSGYPYAGRLVFGLVMLLLGQVVLFFSSALAWQGILDQHLFLPPLDRAVLLFSAVWIVWLWCFARPARLGDLVTGFLNLGVIILFLFTYTGWTASTSGTSGFNDTWMDWAWELSAAFVVLIGMAVLLFSRPAGWGYGIGMLSLMLAGYIGHLAFPSGGDFSGIIRLSQLAAYPLLPTLLNRLNEPAQRAGQGKAAVPPGFHIKERRRYSSSPRTVHAWLELSLKQDPEHRMESLAKGLAHTMLADLCFLVTGPEYSHLILHSGYDLVREEALPGAMLEHSQVPALTSSLRRGKPLQLASTDSQPPDTATLAAALGLSETGSLLFIPLALSDQPVGGLLFLSPYSNRQWSDEDQTYLASELEMVAQIFQTARQQAAGLEPDSPDPRGLDSAGRELRSELENLRRENQRLLDELGALNSDKRGLPQAPAGDLAALIALQQETQEQVSILQAENERLQAALSSAAAPPQELQQMEANLRSTLQEIALLQNQLAESNARNLILERGLRERSGAGAVDSQKVILSLAQEFRQPISAIQGSTGQLLDQSVGLLSSQQRKLLERIRAAAERMLTLLDDLVRIVSPGGEAGGETAAPRRAFVDVSSVIDSAIAQTSAQIREKGIALHVDLPEELPRVYGDPDAIQQVVVRLLQNAGSATPAEGTVTLRARRQAENGAPYLWLQVTDSGGGVSASLPEVKSLVEAYNGRIWANSVAGESTTFNVLLPVQSDHPQKAG